MNDPQINSVSSRFLLTTILLLTLFSGLSYANRLSSEDILVVFNRSIPESKKLADFYIEQRNIPKNQVLGLEMPKKQDISRTEFEESIRTPLLTFFDDEQLWQRSKDASGRLLPTSTKIRAIVLMHGVPLRIKPAPNPTLKDGEKPPTGPIAPRNEASVDSELALFGTENLPIQGVLKNAFYDSKVPIHESKTPFFTLVTRIDAPSYAICERMIADSIATEKNGLWGRAYVDIANKYPQGDNWLESIATKNFEVGIPTIVDRFSDTLPKNYPLTEAALYYGWYTWSANGPFKNPSFKFRPGAIAIHIHSFSAEQLTNSEKNWAAPLLARGASGTVGNVYEPYLNLSHNLSILHERLLDGWTFAEATWAAMPVTSWQAVTIGDPLYRPFLHINGTGEKLERDKDFRILLAAAREWPENDSERQKKVGLAAKNLKSGNLAEGLGLEYLAMNDLPNAENWLKVSQELFSGSADRLRQDVQLAAIARKSGDKQKAVGILRAAKEKYGLIPEVDALSGWLDILDPPPPPAADPTTIPID
ncbi:MAG: TIGR03790 family protein [Akkermansiaceae bacterium]